MSASSPRLLCSMHIQKTAGKSLLSVMQDAYGSERVLTGMDQPERDRLRELSPLELANARVVHGHMPWGFHRWFDRPYVYLAFVRDPVDRVVSYYHYCRIDTNHDCHQLALDLDLEAWVEANPHLCVDNAMTRYFAGRITDMAVRPVHPLDRASMLQEAIENIRTDFPVVGVVERMEQSMSMLRVYYGWAPAPIPVVNANPARPGLDEVPHSLRQRIRELNDLDVALHDFCLQRLERDYPVFCG